MDELSEADKVTVERARKLELFMSQPFTTAEVFTGLEGRYVDMPVTLDDFEKVLAGEGDDCPTGAFHMCGGLEEVKEKAAKMAAKLG